MTSSFTYDELRCQHCDGKSLIRHLPFLGSNLEHSREEKAEVERRRKESEGCKGVEIQLCDEGAAVFPEHNIWCRTLHDDGEEWLYCKDCLACHVRCSRCYANAKKGTTPPVQLCRFVGFCGSYQDATGSVKGKEVGGKSRWVYRLPSPESLLLKKGYEQLSAAVELMARTGKETAERLRIPFTCTVLSDEAMRTYYQDLAREREVVGGLECYLGDLKMYYADCSDARMILTGDDGGHSSCWMCPRCDATYACTDK
jgi:hypothetical protein